MGPGPVVVEADDDAWVGWGADDATDVEVEFSLNKGMMDVGYGGEDEDVAFALELQFPAVA